MENEEKEVIEEKSVPNLLEMVDRLKVENDRAEAILKRNEELVARNLLGGKSDAGIQPVVPKQEEGLEYLKKFKDQIRAS